MPKLTFEQVDYVRRNPEGLTIEKLAEKVGGGFHQVHKALRGKTYKHHPTPPRRKLRGYQFPQAALTPKQVRDIRINRHGKSFKQWSKELGVSPSSVWQAYHCVSYKDVA